MWEFEGLQNNISLSESWGQYKLAGSVLVHLAAGVFYANCHDGVSGVKDYLKAKAVALPVG